MHDEYNKINFNCVIQTENKKTKQKTMEICEFFFDFCFGIFSCDRLRSGQCPARKYIEYYRITNHIFTICASFIYILVYNRKCKEKQAWACGEVVIVRQRTFTD